MPAFDARPAHSASRSRRKITITAMTLVVWVFGIVY